ncbi:transposase [Klebsiella pneumoniae]|nr:transposase [Escherichia coli]TYW96598.1 transposase [Klebsiella pneumoniae]HAX0147153.1 transposase [Escherichia coli JJ2087]HAX0248095.1 transposase [Escherichia coli JMI025]TYX84518.1 transposase [Klebsiella pneumoniae]
MSLKHSDEFKRDAVRIALTSGLTRRQVASDLSIGLSTLGKWIASISDETKIPTQDTDLLRENERWLCCKDWRQSEVGCRSAPIRRLLRNGG